MARENCHINWTCTDMDFGVWISVTKSNFSKLMSLVWIKSNYIKYWVKLT